MNEKEFEDFVAFWARDNRPGLAWEKIVAECRCARDEAKINRVALGLAARQMMVPPDYWTEHAKALLAAGDLP